MFVVFFFFWFSWLFVLFLFVSLPSGSIKIFEWAEQDYLTQTNEAVENSEGKTAQVIFLLRGPAPNAAPVIHCQTCAVGFPIQFGDGGSRDPAQTAEIHLVAVKVSICRLLLFHFAKLISIYLKRVKDKHTVFGVHIKPGWQRVCRQGLSCEAVVSFLWLQWYVWFVCHPESVFSPLSRQLPPLPWTLNIPQPVLRAVFSVPDRRRRRQTSRLPLWVKFSEDAREAVRSWVAQVQGSERTAL